jgi:hypothetical protein
VERWSKKGGDISYHSLETTIFGIYEGVLAINLAEQRISGMMKNHEDVGKNHEIREF